MKHITAKWDSMTIHMTKEAAEMMGVIHGPMPEAVGKMELKYFQLKFEEPYYQPEKLIQMEESKPKRKKKAAPVVEQEPVKDPQPVKEETPAPPAPPAPEPKKEARPKMTLADFTKLFEGTPEELRWKHLVNKVFPNHKVSLPKEAKERGEEWKIAKIAQMCHYANLMYCRINGDDSQKLWDEAEEWQRESAIKGVKFKIENPDAGEDSQHNAWMEDKIADGWVFGEVKDSEKKTHPCLVPFELLPEFQQNKDSLFQLVVEALK